MTALVGTVGRFAVLVALVGLIPLNAGAQGVAGGNIAGVVRDTSGSVLPGVTVEAESPALIEKVRSVVTDGEGRYRIVDLRPGTYAVTFSLAGFRTFRREGVELTTGFNATVNANLEVGAVEETVTVTGEAPLVDTQSVVQQQVLSGEVIRALPVGKTSAIYSAILPAAITNAPTGQDVGGTQSELSSLFSVHGARSNDMLTLRDGMLQNTMLAGAGNNVLSSVNPVTIQESNMQLSGGLSAEAATGGTQINIVPRDGGNQMTASFLADFTHKNLQGANIDDELRARGASGAADVKRLYDVAGGIGGPIAREKLWYFASSRYWINETYAPSNFFNVPALAGTLFYQPDLTRPGYEGNFATEGAVRLAWQATPKHKFAYTAALERNCTCQFGVRGGLTAPEASGDHLYWPYHRHQASWQSPISNRLLLQAGYIYVGGAFNRDVARASSANDIAVLDRTRNFSYANSGAGLGLTQAYVEQDWAQYNFNGSLSYVTGTHAFKVGGLLLKAPKDYEVGIPQDVRYIFAGSAPGVARPEAVTYFATPFGYSVRMTQTALYAQDQWTISRLTLNLGLRYDGLNSYTPARSVPAGPWVGAREFPEVKDIPDWHDVNLRVGAAYDLFGTGRTALKVSIGRFIEYESTAGVPQENNPANLMVTSATRTWNDANGDYVPQANELGPYDNAFFGQIRAGTTWDRAVLEGWHVRPSNWQSGVSVQHELMRGLSVNVGYYRTWYDNFRTTDNRAVTASDFDQYCVTVPTNVNLPNAGEQVCGLFDVKPALFGRVDNFVTKASNFGKQTEVYNGFDVTANARLIGGGMVTGGVSMGRTVTDNCEVLAQLPELVGNATTPGGNNPFCHVESTWGSRSAFKVSVSTPLPWDLDASVNFQNNPAVNTTAVYSVGANEVRLSLGRPLASGQFGRTNVTLLEPNTIYREGRINQLNFAVSRVFRISGARLQPRIELHNALNANTILSLNNQVGPAFDRVTGILAPRMVKVAFRLDY